MSNASGDIISLAADYRAGRATVYVGTYDGLYKSTNGGRSWRGINNGLNTKFEIEVHALAIDPRNPNVVYAGLWGAGVHKTVDGGRSWRVVKRGVSVYALAIDRRRPRIVYAATGSGLNRSTDAGRTWTGQPQKAGRFNRLAIDPSRPGTVYAVAWGGVFKSVDAGLTWREMNDGFPENTTTDTRFRTS